MKRNNPNRASDPIRTVLVQVRRRVFTNRLLGLFFQHLFVGLLLFSAYLLADRLLHFALDSLAVFLGLMGLVVVTTLVRAIWRARTSFFQTAVLVDENLLLKERVSTAVYLRGLREKDSLGDELAEVLDLVERDGAQALSGADVKARFAVRLPRLALWVFLPLGLCAGVFFIPQLDLLGLQSARLAEAAMEEQVQDRIKKVSQKLEEIAYQPEEDPDEAMQKILEAMRKMQPLEEKKPDGSPAKPGEQLNADDAKKTAMVQFSRLEDLLKKNLDQKKFAGLKDLLDKNRLASIDPNALTRQLRDALKRGSLDKAAKELMKLQNKLAALQNKSKLSDEDLAYLQKLAKELSMMSRNSAALAQLSKSLKNLSSGLSAGQLNSAQLGLGQLNMDLDALADLMKQMDFMDQSLELVKLSKQDLGKLHSCPNCGKPRSGPMKPGGT